MSFDWGRGGAAQQIRAKEGQDTYLTDGDGDSFLALSLSNNLYFILIRGARNGDRENVTSAPGPLISYPRKTLFRTSWPCLLQFRASLSNTRFVCWQIPKIPLLSKKKKGGGYSTIRNRFLQISAGANTLL